MTILAIDLGTQSVRAAIVDFKGNILHSSQLKHDVDNPKPGCAQQKPEDWWNLTKDAISTLINNYKGDIKELEALSTCGQMHGPVGIDPNGNITTKWTQIWMDKRSESICKLIRNRYDESELAKVTANPITTGWPGIKIRWIKDNQKKIYDKTEYFLVPKDFINYKLTDVVATDHSEASGTYLYDHSKEDYSEEMQNVLEIDLTKLAPIKNSYDIIGTLENKVAKDLGLPNQLPVIAGGGDFIVSLLGLGLVDDSTAVDMTGTSTLFVVYKNKPIIEPTVQNLRHVTGGWIPFTILDCGGLAMKWCKDFLNSMDNCEISYEKMIELAKDAEIGCKGLIFYPYMLGERRKENIKAQGSFFGLTLTHQAKELCRSVMEGVALAIGKDVLNFKRLGIDLQQVHCLGGATRNHLLYQIKANVMNLPQIITNQPESSLSGCGLLASYGLGKIKKFKRKKIEDSQIVFQPSDKAVKQYESLQEKFNLIYNHMLGFWKK